MREDTFLRGLFVLFISLILAFGLFSQSEADQCREGIGRRYGGYVSGGLLPGYLAALLIVLWIFLGKGAAVRLTLTLCFGVFLHICLYYLLLIPALPFFGGASAPGPARSYGCFPTIST